MAPSITLAITGDVMLGRLVNETITRKGFAYPWGDMLPLLREADLVLINLECALTAETERWHDGGHKAFYFRSNPANVATLTRPQVSFASLANNHICDFGTNGLRETLDVLDRAGIAHAGAGMDLGTARTSACLSAGGTRIHIVAFADHPLAWAASATSPGINYTPVSVDPEDFAVVAGAVAEARHDADLVIFSIHWGPNMRSRPTWAFRAFAHRVMDAGADIFWGHSAHLVQGIELYGSKPILYDTGDFVDDYAVDEDARNDLSALFRVRVGPLGMERVELTPVKIDSMQVNVAGPEDRRLFVRRLTSFCAELGATLTDEDGRLAVFPHPEAPAAERVTR